MELYFFVLSGEGDFVVSGDGELSGEGSDVFTFFGEGFMLFLEKFSCCFVEMAAKFKVLKMKL